MCAVEPSVTLLYISMHTNSLLCELNFVKSVSFQYSVQTQLFWMEKAGMFPQTLNWVKIKSPRILLDKKISYFQVIPSCARFLIPLITSLQVRISRKVRPQSSLICFIHFDHRHFEE